MASKNNKNVKLYKEDKKYVFYMYFPFEFNGFSSCEIYTKDKGKYAICKGEVSHNGVSFTYLRNKEFVSYRNNADLFLNKENAIRSFRKISNKKISLYVYGMTNSIIKSLYLKINPCKI